MQRKTLALQFGLEQRGSTGGFAVLRGFASLSASFCRPSSWPRFRRNAQPDACTPFLLSLLSHAEGLLRIPERLGRLCRVHRPRKDVSNAIRYVFTSIQNRRNSIAHIQRLIAHVSFSIEDVFNSITDVCFFVTDVCFFVTDVCSFVKYVRYSIKYVC